MLNNNTYIFFLIKIFAGKKYMYYLRSVKQITNDKNTRL